MTLPAISGAPSVSNSLNTPKRNTISSIRNFATFSAVCCVTQHATEYLVTYSTAAITYLSPPVAMGNGPATSKAHLSPTAPPLKLRNGGITSQGFAFLEPHSGHPRTHRLTSLYSPGHQYN
ncbi:unnamed protein product [Phytophthora fragariaefolia]|uniref:Unnamed protein product n=1 Tax=Phytophthora fragariaefolia TaxID=1490495 RepID=A0A9W7CZ36_9STRA|nr:unnamed protein product [Phytophthora fragariaefolia]